MVKIQFPDGTVMRASPLADRRASDVWRDFGLYLDPGWNPNWPADIVDWPDFGVPASSEDAFQSIRAAFERARSGERVEVGCLGGLGRTGTVLACCAVLCCDLEPHEAVQWVRTNYDKRAVETRAQEQWVGWFAARLREEGREA